MASAYVKYGMQQCLGVATDPIDGGRSYDFAIGRGSPPIDWIEKLRSMRDPFASTEPL
jgi:hypothetical protein